MKSLVVDDSRTIRKIARQHLTTLGHTVREAVDGADALEKCAEDMPELILLDWNMPMMTGIEFVRALRKAEHGDQPKVIFCTTEGDMDHIKEALEAGADEYLIKPFDLDVLEWKCQLVRPAA